MVFFVIIITVIIAANIFIFIVFQHIDKQNIDIIFRPYHRSGAIIGKSFVHVAISRHSNHLGIVQIKKSEFLSLFLDSIGNIIETGAKTYLTKY